MIDRETEAQFKKLYEKQTVHWWGYVESVDGYDIMMQVANSNEHPFKYTPVKLCQPIAPGYDPPKKPELNSVFWFQGSIQNLENGRITLLALPYRHDRFISIHEFPERLVNNARAAAIKSLEINAIPTNQIQTIELMGFFDGNHVAITNGIRMPFYLSDQTNFQRTQRIDLDIFHQKLVNVIYAGVNSQTSSPNIVRVTVIPSTAVPSGVHTVVQIHSPFGNVEIPINEIITRANELASKTQPSSVSLPTIQPTNQSTASESRPLSKTFSNGRRDFGALKESSRLNHISPPPNSPSIPLSSSTQLASSVSLSSSVQPSPGQIKFRRHSPPSLEPIPSVTETVNATITHPNFSVAELRMNIPKLLEEKRNNLICPLTGQIMIEPCSDGIGMYENVAFDQFVGEFNLNPSTLQSRLDAWDKRTHSVQKRKINEYLRVNQDRVQPTSFKQSITSQPPTYRLFEADPIPQLANFSTQMPSHVRYSPVDVGASPEFFLPIPTMVLREKGRKAWSVQVDARDGRGEQLMQLLLQRKDVNGKRLERRERRPYLFHLQVKPSDPSIRWLPERVLENTRFSGLINMSRYSFRIVSLNTIEEGKELFRREFQKITNSSFAVLDGPKPLGAAVQEGDDETPNMQDDEDEVEDFFEMEEERWAAFKGHLRSEVVQLMKDFVNVTPNARGGHKLIVANPRDITRAPPLPDKHFPSASMLIQASMLLSMIKRKLAERVDAAALDGLCDRVSTLVEGTTDYPDLHGHNAYCEINNKTRQIVELAYGLTSLLPNPTAEMNEQASSLFIMRMLNFEFSLITNDHPFFNNLQQSILSTHPNGVREFQVFLMNNTNDDWKVNLTRNVIDRGFKFHGSSVNNWSTIIAVGPQPYQLPRFVSRPGDQTNYGVFFADMLKTSNDYTVPSPAGYRYVAIAEVALGPLHAVGDNHNLVTCDIYQHDRIYATGQRPTGSVQVDGLDLPIGWNGLQYGYNEFIVFSPEQIRLRFMIKYK
ncbi:putative Poly(ADP-ribose) polymerase catalytic domain containing protein [Blattamonas nauphoetae]|uniref:Poly(ADP-ribose) polymerase catalytic domain containing protein n=1 Tax=Blattamonas nauphoetae TaxID=2049346 RepID=A0ABQ9WVM2_9EUKA|nr:putative Poly(ADP-ribose) polymerase catalytic domain containing protein [Blattamonas nauphoetae]